MGTTCSRSFKTKIRNISTNNQVFTNVTNVTNVTNNNPVPNTSSLVEDDNNQELLVTDDDDDDDETNLSRNQINILRNLVRNDNLSDEKITSYILEHVIRNIFNNTNSMSGLEVYGHRISRLINSNYLENVFNIINDNQDNGLLNNNRMSSLLSESSTISKRLGKFYINNLTSEIYDSETMKYTECVVCLDEFNQGDSITKLPCGHIYHKKCLLPWFERKMLCPTCNVPVLS